MIPIALAFLALVFGGVAYFNARIRLCLIFLAAASLLNVWICHGLLVPGHGVIFWLAVCILVLWPAFLLTLFGLDVKYGWFCFDMSYSWAFVWVFSVILFCINLACSVIQFLLAGT